MTPWTVACHAPLSMGLSGQESWSRLPFPSPGDLSHPGSEPTSPALAGGFFTAETPGKLLFEDLQPSHQGYWHSFHFIDSSKLDSEE